MYNIQSTKHISINTFLYHLLKKIIDNFFCYKKQNIHLSKIKNYIINNRSKFVKLITHDLKQTHNFFIIDKN